MDFNNPFTIIIILLVIIVVILALTVPRYYRGRRGPL